VCKVVQSCSQAEWRACFARNNHTGRGCARMLALCASPTTPNTTGGAETAGRIVAWRLSTKHKQCGPFHASAPCALLPSNHHRMRCYSCRRGSTWEAGSSARGKEAKYMPGDEVHHCLPTSTTAGGAAAAGGAVLWGAGARGHQLHPCSQRARQGAGGAAVHQPASVPGGAGEAVAGVCV